MEKADDIVWQGDAEERFLERAAQLESWGNYQGKKDLGKRLIAEVRDKIKDIAANLNQYPVRDKNKGEHLVPLNGNVLVYKKEPYTEGGKLKMRLVLISVRPSY